MNFYDSSVIENKIVGMGFALTDTVEDADVVVLNTCHIREKAAQKMYSELGRIRSALSHNPNAIISVAGCVAQAEGEEIIRRAPYVDVVVGSQSIQDIAEMILKVKRDKSKEIKLEFDANAKFDSLPESLNSSNSKFSALLSVQEGCDKFCSFCCVPYTRGAEFSRPVEQVYKEAKLLVENGFKEITLLGQNVNGYHGLHESGVEFSLGKLMNMLSGIDGIDRIRYTTSHPMDMHEDLYQVHDLNPKVMPFMNLPVQSGSDSVLKRMNRKYTSDDYCRIVDRLRKNKNVAISSDFIVGFPGETDKDFGDTLELVRKIGFANAYSFKYSPRPGTPGAEFKDQVPEEVKSQRLHELQFLLDAQKLSYNESFIGKELEVLFDKKTDDGQVCGRSPYMQSVYSDNANYYGKIVKVLISEAYNHSLRSV